MTPKQFKEIRLRMGFTQEKMGRMIGVSKRAVQYYESGQRKISPMAVMVMRMILARSLMSDL